MMGRTKRDDLRPAVGIFGSRAKYEASRLL
jgi:hypothetical protein